MYPVWGAVILDLALLIWLVILSVLFWREKKFLNKVFPSSEKPDIREKFKELLDKVEQYERKSQIVNKNLQGIRKEGLSHIQDIAMLRYNPYNDTGGDQSFSVVFLDGKLDGVLVTSLHSRAGTRIYVKNIVSGKSDLELSKEERQVLEQAIINKQE